MLILPKKTLLSPSFHTVMMQLYRARICNYIELVPKTFLSIAGVQSWRQGDVFAKEPVRRMIAVMSINEAYLGTNRINPFHYQTFGLNEIILYRNGLIIVGTLFEQQTKEEEFITIRLNLLIFLNTSHGVSFANYDNH